MTPAETHLFAALADPTRRTLLGRLAYGPATAGQLAELAAMSRPGVSQHLKVLREAALVRATRQGKFQWYELDGARLVQAEAWLRDLTDRWAAAPTLRDAASRPTAKEPA
jgi:DNA-binding transcriptional ArsR family regulator